MNQKFRHHGYQIIDQLNQLIVNLILIEKYRSNKFILLKSLFDYKFNYYLFCLYFKYLLSFKIFFQNFFFHFNHIFHEYL